MEYAPIIIYTLNRYHHLKMMLDSLNECTGIEKTEVYISIDYPPDESYAEGHRKVIEVVDSYDFSKWKSVHIYKQDKNLGVPGNAEFLVNKIRNHHDWIISLEDDNIFSKNYLQFVNKSVKKFKKDPKFLGACGISVMDTEEQRWFKAFTLGQGAILSISRRDSVLRKVARFYEKKADVGPFMRVWTREPIIAAAYISFLLNNPDVYYDENGKLVLIDLNISFWMAYSGYYVVRPVLSMVRNIGFDGTGVNCAEDEEMASIEMEKNIDGNVDFSFSKVQQISRVEAKKIQKYGIYNTEKRNWKTLILYFMICIIGTENVRHLRSAIKRYKI